MLIEFSFLAELKMGLDATHTINHKTVNQNSSHCLLALFVVEFVKI